MLLILTLAKLHVTTQDLQTQVYEAPNGFGYWARRGHSESKSRGLKKYNREVPR
jgi:hypothetical protein